MSPVLLSQHGSTLQGASTASDIQEPKSLQRVHGEASVDRRTTQPHRTRRTAHPPIGRSPQPRPAAAMRLPVGMGGGGFAELAGTVANCSWADVRRFAPCLSSIVSYDLCSLGSGGMSLRVCPPLSLADTQVFLHIFTKVEWRGLKPRARVLGTRGDEASRLAQDRAHAHARPGLARRSLIPRPATTSMRLWSAVSAMPCAQQFLEPEPCTRPCPHLTIDDSCAPRTYALMKKNPLGGAVCFPW